MRDGPRGFGQDSSCPGLLRCRLRPRSVFAYGALTRCGAAFQRLRLTSCGPFADGPTTPVGAETPPVWAPARSLATTCAIIGLFSLPPGTEMFQFPGFAPPVREVTAVGSRVAPFGNPRIKGYLLLPVAYRSLSRPSSPPRAKASFMCPSLLSL